MCKVYTDVGGIIKWWLKLVDYLHLQTDNPWYNYYFFFLKLGKMSQKLLSAAVVIGALRVIDTV